MPEPFTPPSIVVGVDGSRAGIRAALWAARQAIRRGFPLRLLSVAESLPDAADAAGADAAVRSAAAAVESAGLPITPEMEVVVGAPTPALLDASRTAAMVCVGTVGVRHFDPNRVGSTAGALVASAHCPVALVRGGDRPVPTNPGWVVVELDETPDSAAVLQYGVEEARLRTNVLRVVGTWQSRHSDGYDVHAVDEGNRLVRAQLDRRLEIWTHRYPDLDVQPVAVHGSGLGYVSDNAAAIALVIIGVGNTGSVEALLSPAGLAALQNTDCSILVIDRQRLL